VSPNTPVAHTLPKVRLRDHGRVIAILARHYGRYPETQECFRPRIALKFRHGDSRTVTVVSEFSAKRAFGMNQPSHDDVRSWLVNK